MSMYLYKAVSSSVISEHTYVPESEKIKSMEWFSAIVANSTKKIEILEVKLGC